MVDAALGASCTVEQLDGEELTIDIAPGTQPGESITLQGKGMPRLRTDGYGNLFAHVDVVVPTDLDKKTREALEKVRAAGHGGTEVHRADDDHGESLFSRFRDKFRR